MEWFTTRKSGLDSVNLQELLGLGSYYMVWPWLPRVRHCTIRKDRKQLSGRDEVDEFSVCGKKHGKHGRGAEGQNNRPCCY